MTAVDLSSDRADTWLRELMIPPTMVAELCEWVRMSCLRWERAEMREDINETTELPPLLWSDHVDPTG